MLLSTQEKPSPELIRLATEVLAKRQIEREEAAKRVESERLIEANAYMWEDPTIWVDEPPSWFHAHQLEAFNSTATDLVVAAGHQSGKTALEPYYMLRDLQRAAPFIAWMGFGNAIFAGPTLELLKDQAIPTFRRLFENEYNLGKTTLGGKPAFKFSREGLKALFGFTDIEVAVKFAHANDSNNLESVTACVGVWDEAGQKDNKETSLEAFDRRLTTARSTTFATIKKWIDSDEKRTKLFAWWVERYFNREGPDATFGRRMFGSTPYEWNFFKTRVYDRAFDGDEGFQLVNFPTWANPRNSKENAMKAKDKMPEWKWTMFYLGLFTKPAGVIFDTYTVVKSELIDPSAMRGAGHDFGKLNNCGIWAYKHPTRTSKEGKPQWVVYSTYLNGNRSALEHIQSFLYCEEPGNTDTDTCKSRDHKLWRVGRKQESNGTWKPIPPWAWGGNNTTEGDSRELYTQYGYTIMQPPVSSVLDGIDILYGMLKTEEIVIEEGCTLLITELDTYTFEIGDDGEPDELKIQNKHRFHRCDALRYFAAGVKFQFGDVVHHKAAPNMDMNPNRVRRQLKPMKEEKPEHEQAPDFSIRRARALMAGGEDRSALNPQRVMV